eukprot:jgi/Bigna1/71451/fgenesh1_pg.15_\
MISVGSIVASGSLRLLSGGGPARSRRAIVTQLGPGIALSTCINSLTSPRTSYSFENRLPVKLEPYPKTPGPQPKDLGLRSDGSLKGCDFVKPNCFSTSANPDDIEGELYKSYLVQPFKYSKGRNEAFQDILNVLKSYEVGHDNIDGGGFKIVKQDEKNGYVYVQYESLKKGYIDDFEVSVNPDGTVGLRTASRLGFLDLRVNAKRFNYIASKLGDLPGWSAPPVTSKTHPQYFQMNRM